MSIKIISKHDNIEKLGVSFRGHRAGPEHELIEEYLKSLKVKVPRGCTVTIFREPRISSGFPDLVLVIWNTSAAARWHPSRALLKNEDIRLMHYIALNGLATHQEIDTLYGNKAAKSLERLQAAEMILSRRNFWVARTVSKCFAVKHIIAIEAKMTQWRNALAQAYLNTWFASSSCIMLPQLPKSKALLSEAKLLGIGIHLLENTLLDYRDVPTEASPRSYVSRLFNEWVWRAERDEPRTEAKYAN